MSDPTQPNEPVRPSDPTQQMPTSGVTPPPATTTTTTRTPAGPPPGSGGLGGGVVALIAIGAAAIALLIGFVVWGQDDDDADPVAEDAATSVPEDTAPEETVADTGDEVADLESQVDDLQSELDDVTGERDDLQSQLDDADGATVELENLEGMSIDDVRDLAGDNGWDLIEQSPDSPADDAETDVVLSQSPDSGTAMSNGSALVVEVVPS